jgi:small GTP-binding protein
MFPRVDSEPRPPRYKLKVCLLGDQKVGKTSLTRRFAYNEFSDQYVETLGTVVSRKPIVLKGGPQRIEANVLVWDIVGRKSMAELLGEAYFTGSHGALLVFDLTRPETLENLRTWRDVLHREAPEVPIVVVGNKSDLKEPSGKLKAALDEFCGEAKALQHLTSAKTGEGVEDAFSALVKEIVAKGVPPG